MISVDLGLEKVFVAGPQSFERASLIDFHKRGIARDIGSENGGKLAFHERFPSQCSKDNSTSLVTKYS